MNTTLIYPVLVPSHGFGTIEIEYQINPVGSKEIYSYGKSWLTRYGKRVTELDTGAVKRMNHLLDKLVMDATLGINAAREPDQPQTTTKKKPKPKPSQSTDDDWGLPLV